MVEGVNTSQRVVDADRDAVEQHRVEWCVGAMLLAARMWRRGWDEKKKQWQLGCQLYRSNILAEVQRRRELDRS